MQDVNYYQMQTLITKKNKGVLSSCLFVITDAMYNYGEKFIAPRDGDVCAIVYTVSTFLEPLPPRVAHCELPTHSQRSLLFLSLDGAVLASTKTHIASMLKSLVLINRGIYGLFEGVRKTLEPILT